jgi:hypothetical protein
LAGWDTFGKGPPFCWQGSKLARVVREDIIATSLEKSEAWDEAARAIAGQEGGPLPHAQEFGKGGRDGWRWGMVAVGLRAGLDKAHCARVKPERLWFFLECGGFRRFLSRAICLRKSKYKAAGTAAFQK